jgi:protein MAK11
MQYFQLNGKDYIVTGSEDKTIRIWDVQSGECVKEIKGHQLRVKAISVVASEDKIVLISVSSDGIIKCWDLAAALEQTEVTPLGEYNTKCRATCITSHVGFAKVEAMAAEEAKADLEAIKEKKLEKKKVKKTK